MCVRCARDDALQELNKADSTVQTSPSNISNSGIRGSSASNSHNDAVAREAAALREEVMQPTCAYTEGREVVWLRAAQAPRDCLRLVGPGTPVRDADTSQHKTQAPSIP